MGLSSACVKAGGAGVPFLQVALSLGAVLH